MPKRLRPSFLAPFNHRLAVGVSIAAVVTAFVTSVPSAQEKPVHLNPAIAKLAEGKTVYYSGSGLDDQSAREAGRAPFDFAFVDQEHAPLDFAGLRRFLMAATAYRAVAPKRPNVNPAVAVMARFPSDFGAAGFFVKQALDIGLMGIYFPNTGSKEQALSYVKAMRYPQARGAKDMEPAGLRGKAGAPWSWGLSGDEYEQHADLWPLDPNGDLLAMMMIESVDGVKNVDAIASVPGVGALTAAAGEDLSTSMGVPNGSPEVEAGFQQVLKACKAHNVKCAIAAGTNTGEGVAKRVREGWSIIRTNEAARTAGMAILGEK